MQKNCLPAIFFFFLNTSAIHAQGTRGNDTIYYVYFPNSITARLYVSQKYTAYTLKGNGSKKLHYLPNTTLNLGIGATYHNFSLNLAYGFGFLNTDVSKGKTNYLDLQAHAYKPKWVTDFYGQLYKGYHLDPDGFAAPPGKDYYYRHDVKVTLFGLSQYRIFNPRRFSYNAAIIQNEWQKKSAGTLLAGAEVYYGVVKADSNFVPEPIQDNYTQKDIKSINYFSIGPGAGYAYTLVIAQHIFITGSLTGNVNFSYTTEHSTGNSKNHFSVNPVTRFRAAAGYNGRTWDVSANWIADDLHFTGSNQSKYVFNTGNYRFIIARRFNAGNRLQHHLRLVNKVFKE
ncbi:MAG: DUF4421 domain-containing protein [Ginsengibacter sp.]